MDEGYAYGQCGSLRSHRNLRSGYTRAGRRASLQRQRRRIR